VLACFVYFEGLLRDTSLILFVDNVDILDRFKIRATQSLRLVTSIVGFCRRFDFGRRGETSGEAAGAYSGGSQFEFKMSTAPTLPVTMSEDDSKDNGNVPVMKDEGTGKETTTTEVTEGKAVIRCDSTRNIFYNPIQEFNRDIRYKIFLRVVIKAYVFM